VELASYFHLKPAIQVMLSQMTRGWDRLRREIIGCVFSPLVFFLLLSAAVVFFFFLPNMDAWYELKGTPGSDELLIGHGRLF